MSAAWFVLALAVGAAALALWVDVRFPRLAPSGAGRRVVAAAVGTCLVSAVPLQPTVARLVGLLLPALCFAFLTALWLLRLLYDQRA